MAKIRNKVNTSGFTKFLDESSIVKTCIKSGINTKNDRKFKIDEYLSFSFFENTSVHSNTGFENDALPYDDNKTINFVQKNVIDTLNIEEKYITDNLYNSQNKILSSPNKFYGLSGSENQYSTRSLNTSSIHYDRMLKENYLETKTSNYRENDYIIDNNEDYDTITIDFDLNKSQNKDLYLSFSKKENTREVTFPGGKSYYTFNGNTAYFYNNDFIKNNFGPFDYVGNISDNYFNDAAGFIDRSPICFNSVTPHNSLLSVYENANNFEDIQWGGIPIDTFGFPFSKKFDAEPRHTIPASKYITRPFVIEKVKLNVKLSNWSVSKIQQQDPNGTYDEYYPCINFVNFFVMNQRNKVNKNSLDQTKSVSYKNTDSDPHQDLSVNLDNLHTTGDTIYTTNNKSSNNTFDQNQINNMEAGIFSDYIQHNRIPNIDQNIGASNSNKGQQKEIITTVTIANYSTADSNRNSHRINFQKINQISDVLINKSQIDLLDSANTAECIYENEDIEVTVPVKNFFENKLLPSFTNFNVFSKKTYDTKTNFEKRTYRSLPGETLSGNLFNSEITENNVKVYEKDYLEGKYILDPDDNLVFGVSLSTAFQTQELISTNQANVAQRFGEDLVKISCGDNQPIQVHLIGYYLEDKNKKTIKNKEVKSYKNSKRIGYDLQEIIDKLGSDLSYLEQNFYDRDFVGEASYNVNKGKFSNNNKTKLGNFFELPSYGLISVEKNKKYTNTLTDDYFTYENSNGGTEFYPAKQYFNKYSFGQIVDRLNHNRHYQYKKSKYYNIFKKFMKGFYLQKTPARVKGSVNLDFLGFHEYTGRNFLTEKIFTGQETFTWDLILGNSISVNLSILSIDITDEKDQKIKLIFRIPIFTGAANEKLIYSSVDSGGGGFNGVEKEYINNILHYKVNFENYYADSFINLNYNTSLSVANYDSNERILNVIKSLCESIKNHANNAFNQEKINIDCKINDNNQKEIIKLDFEITNRGKLNNASLKAGESGSNVTYETFAVEEGDLLNSYNTNSSASYSEENIIFKDK